MTHVTVRNISPGLKSLTNSEKRSINLMPGDVRTFDMHPVHARMLLVDAARKNPSFEVEIDPAERASMEQAVEEARRGMPLTQAERAKQPVPTTQHFITDPKTVPDGPGPKSGKKSKPKGKETRVALKR
jgi:hypothetical protein